MKEKAGRIEYLDALKGISIMLVVFCHIPLMPNETVVGNLFMALAWLAVPCFMLCSGALMHQKQTFSFKKHFTKLGTLYLCFVVWRLVHVAVFLIRFGMSIRVKELIEFTFFFKEIEAMGAGHMWFMVAYFLVMLFFPISFYLFRKCGKEGRKVLILVLILTGIAGMLLPSLRIALELLSRISPVFIWDLSSLYAVLPFSTSANMIFYFVLGAFLFEYRESISKWLGKKKYLLGPMVFVGAGLMITVKAAETGSFFWNGIYVSEGYNRLTTLIMAVCSYLFFAEFADRLKKAMHVMAVCVGQHTMGIFYIHFFILSFCNQFFFQRITAYYSFGLNVLKTLVVTCVCVLLTLVLKKIPVIRKLVS